MTFKSLCAIWFVATISVIGLASSPPRTTTPTIPLARNSPESATMRLEGEKRFRTNCSRCHAAPQKFPPRMMATIIRHMRVRATITDEDMRLVLFYMTQ